MDKFPEKDVNGSNPLNMEKNKTNYIMRACIQLDTDAQAIMRASEIASFTNEWIELDCKNGRSFDIGPKGEVLPKCKKG